MFKKILRTFRGVLKLRDKPILPDEDPTSLGSILHTMGRIPRSAIRLAEDAKKTHPGHRIGFYLVRLGYLSAEDLYWALAIQDGLRSRSRAKRALAQSSIAKASSDQIKQMARDIRVRSDEVKRRSNQNGYPAITTEIKKN
jgi:hypothetical protein